VFIDEVINVRLSEGKKNSPDKMGLILKGLFGEVE
jgi:hypothetical protein